jgi:hypothetical protein
VHDVVEEDDTVSGRSLRARQGGGKHAILHELKHARTKRHWHYQPAFGIIIEKKTGCKLRSSISKHARLRQNSFCVS